ncbi:MAG: hypothetical protein ACRDCN_07915, partial [Tannerellaceae bacterium]
PDFCLVLVNIIHSVKIQETNTRSNFRHNSLYNSRHKWLHSSLSNLYIRASVHVAQLESMLASTFTFIDNPINLGKKS